MLFATKIKIFIQKNNIISLQLIYINGSQELENLCFFFFFKIFLFITYNNNFFVICFFHRKLIPSSIQFIYIFFSKIKNFYYIRGFVHM